MAGERDPVAGIGKGQDEGPRKGAKERLYDKVKLPLWALDLIILALVAALVIVIIIGTR
ncbi:MAG: hypothetical protein AB9880_08655 [Christensenellales bacterium]